MTNNDNSITNDVTGNKLNPLKNIPAPGEWLKNSDINEELQNYINDLLNATTEQERTTIAYMMFGDPNLNPIASPFSGPGTKQFFPLFIQSNYANAWKDFDRSDVYDYAYNSLTNMRNYFKNVNNPEQIFDITS